MTQLRIKSVLFVTSILALTAGNCLLAESPIEVNRDMLLWKKGFAYRTQVLADISLTNTKIKVNLSDRTASGSQPRSFWYSGAMAYNTELQRNSDINGCAVRYYEQCDITKSETNPLTLKVDSGFWEVWAQRFWISDIPKEWRPHVEVVERHAGFGDSYTMVRQKPGSPDLLGGGALELAFQSMGVLSKKWFLLEWPRMKSIQKAKMNVSAAEPREGHLIATSGGVSNTVKDVIGRESKLLYEALLGFDGNRKEGDLWVVDGETLDAMVHPTVKGSFRGSALVRAELVKNKSPVRTVDEMNGFKLQFVSRGIVAGRRNQSAGYHAIHTHPRHIQHGGAENVGFTK